jgi:hypothetical protein
MFQQAETLLPQPCPDRSREQHFSPEAVVVEEPVAPEEAVEAVEPVEEAEAVEEPEEAED